MGQIVAITKHLNKYDETGNLLELVKGLKEDTETHHETLGVPMMCSVAVVDAKSQPVLDIIEGADNVLRRIAITTDQMDAFLSADFDIRTPEPQEHKVEEQHSEVGMWIVTAGEVPDENSTTFETLGEALGYIVEQTVNAKIEKDQFIQFMITRGH